AHATGNGNGGKAPRRKKSDISIYGQESNYTTWRLAKMNLALNAVDDILGHADDKPSIGLLLVKERDRLVVEYALAGTSKPMGVAQWERQITQSLPEELKASLPTVEELEAELGREELKYGG
ncbi:MAG: PDDEXK nuclease domain-containing protein, partial [Pirellulales bacterium]